MFTYELLNGIKTKKPRTSNNIYIVVKIHLHENNDQNKFWDHILLNFIKQVLKNKIKEIKI